MHYLPRRDLLLTLFVILIWGGHFAVIKAGVTTVDPLIALAIRFGVTVIVFLPFMRWPGKAVFWKLAEIGILMSVLHLGSLFIAMRTLDSASVAVLMQSQTIFTVILGRIFLGEWFGWRTMLGLAVSATGVVVMLGVPDVANHPGSFVTLMVSALILSFSYIRMRQLPKVEPMTFIAVINTVAFPFIFAASFFTGGIEGWKAVEHANWWSLGGVLAYQVILISLTHIIWQRLLSRNEVARVTSMTLLVPLVAITISIGLLGLQPTLPLFIGAGLILAGVGFVVLRRVQLHRNEPIAIIE